MCIGKITYTYCVSILSENKRTNHRINACFVLGIGCIHMSLIDSDHKPVHIFPTNHRVRPDVFEAEFYLHTFQEFNNVKTVEEIKPDQAG